MAWDPAISRKINVAFEAGDAAKFLRQLRKLPQYLRCEDGTDLWMWRAAQEGSLTLLQAAVYLGVDVNESKDIYNPDNPFSQAEGPIL